MTARPGRRTRDRLIALGGLTVIWMLLWGVFSWATLLGGLVVAAVVLAVFPLPPVTFVGRPHPMGLVRFAARFLVDLVAASAHLAWTAFRFGYRPRSAVIAVRLAVRSDLNLTLCGEAVSLIPGSLIVDTDRAAGVLYIHVFDVRDPEAVEEFRREVHALEARIVRAIGSEAELKQITNEKGQP
ncbi:Na+/H+ antiporter subunit E [Plantactinospora veratri]|uniref:Na+/H+ antiporter subunit E n=1 Tax=Plantactinospora veratri TaxID=1436122 RepID=A0ABU7SGM4_9ACTN